METVTDCKKKSAVGIGASWQRKCFPNLNVAEIDIENVIKKGCNRNVKYKFAKIYIGIRSSF